MSDPLKRLKLAVERLEDAAAEMHAAAEDAVRGGGLDADWARALALRAKAASALAFRGGCAVLWAVEREAGK